MQIVQFLRPLYVLGALGGKIPYFVTGYQEHQVDEHDELTERIIGAAIEVHRILGPGLLESIYVEALAVELQSRDMECMREVGVDVVYKNHIIKGQRIDLIVANELVVEVKSVSKLPDVAVAQLLSYLKTTKLHRGLLLNFGCSRMVDGIKRVSL